MGYYQTIAADCVEEMAAMGEATVDAIVCDPPYELGFMGKAWDASGVAYRVETWAEAYRVLKPGGHLLAFGGTRTSHRLVCAIEDAGFEIRDSLIWLYGSGFPKSLDVSKAIDKAAGAEREVVGQREYAGGHVQRSSEDKLAPPIGTFKRTQDRCDETAPATPDAERWEGWGTALKPAHEPIVMARKPLIGTVAANVLAHDTGALNIDACRIGMSDEDRTTVDARSGAGYTDQDFLAGVGRDPGERYTSSPAGRWPANLVLSHSEDCVCVGERRVKPKGCTPMPNTTQGGAIFNLPGQPEGPNYLDEDGMETVEAWECVPGCPVRALDDQTGGLHTQRPTNSMAGASRFFYCAKASRAERNAGVDGPEAAAKRTHSGGEDTRGRPTPVNRNTHPTVKPVKLMRWLVRLVTPPDGLVLDPFMGSGTTGIAALREGFSFVGIDRDPDYVEIAQGRIANDAGLFAEIVV